MKKVFLAMIFAGITAISAQAQFFAGGTIGLDSKMDKSTSGSKTNKGPSDFSLEFSPRLGYYLTPKLGAGVAMKLAMGTHNNRAEEPRKDKSFEWGFGPFLRYAVLSRGDFSILMEGGMGVFGRTTKVSQGTTTEKGPKTFGLDFSIMPLLSYNLSSKISLEARSNLARFGFDMQTRKTGSGESKYKNTETSFGFGLDSDDFFKSPYQIGMIFKF